MQKIPLDLLTNHMIVQHGEINSSNKNHNNKYKGDIINVTKTVVRKSILMQITRTKAANAYR
jgi:hypothetical protein